MKLILIQCAWCMIVCIVVLVLVSVFVWVVQVSVQQVCELMSVFGVNWMFQQMNVQMVGMMGQQLFCVLVSYWNNFFDEKGMVELIEKMILIYQWYFSVVEIDGLLKFYCLLFGCKVVVEMLFIMVEGMQVGQQWGCECVQVMMEQLQKDGIIIGEGCCFVIVLVQLVLGKLVGKLFKQGFGVVGLWGWLRIDQCLWCLL